MKVSIKEDQENNTFKDIKKSFTGLLENLEKQFKKNNYLFRDKYIEVLEELENLNECVNEGYGLLFSDHSRLSSTYDNPLELIKYFTSLLQTFIQEYKLMKKKRSNVKQETIDILTKVSAQRIFETLANKNLQSYDLREEVSELNIQLRLSKQKNKIAEEMLENLTKTYQENEQNNFKLLLAISDLLKKAQTNQIQLKQSNRLLKELLQTHKIQFERYKSNFKVKDSLKDRQQKLKRVLEKRYKEREKIIIKQLSYESEQTYRKTIK